MADDQPPTTEHKESGQENTLLMRQIELLDDQHSRKIINLEKEIILLRNSNFELCRHLDWYRRLDEESQDRSIDVDRVKKLSKQLEKRNIENEERINQISTLRNQINSAEAVKMIFKGLETGNDVEPALCLRITKLETEIRQVASLLSQCLSPSQLTRFCKQPKRTNDLSEMVRSTVGKMKTLSSSPEAAFRAMLFGFVRDRVFYSERWAALNLEGFMFRGHQALIQQMGMLLLLGSDLPLAYIQSSARRDYGSIKSRRY